MQFKGREVVINPIGRPYTTNVSQGVSTYIPTEKGQAEFVYSVNDRTGEGRINIYFYYADKVGSVADTKLVYYYDQHYSMDKLPATYREIAEALQEEYQKVWCED